MTEWHGGAAGSCTRHEWRGMTSVQVTWPHFLKSNYCKFVQARND